MSSEASKLVNKLHITEIKTREEMTKKSETPHPEWRVYRLTLFMEHAAFCQKERCVKYFCPSIKSILEHIDECFDLKCDACLRFNVLIFEHVRNCEDSRTCRIPGCLSIARAIGTNKETAEEQGPSALNSKNQKRRNRRKAKKAEKQVMDQL
ncbi:unnamed protein product [Caenorhabditis sp. 36 PRJEB53466]|nr:unnamed protein product [Caenorhabditis sp. 36 PRJEB53466]